MISGLGWSRGRGPASMASQAAAGPVLQQVEPVRRLIEVILPVFRLARSLK